MKATHTPTPWEVDTVRNEGEYGDGGPDSHSGFESFAIIDADGHVLFDTMNRDGAVTEVDEESDDEDGYHRAWDRRGQADAEHAVRCVNLHDELVATLRLLLDQVDYTRGACGLTEMVGACLDAKVIDRVHAVIARATGSAS